MASTATPFSRSFRASFQPRRVDALLSLQKAAQQISTILELDDLLDFIVHRVALDFGCIESSILLVEGENFHLAAVHGCTQSKKGERWPITEGLSGQVVVTGRAHYAPDVSQELHYRACEPNIRSEILIPLKVGERVIGVFCASHHELNAFPRGQFELLKGLAGHIAVAVHNAQRVRQERQQIYSLQKEQDEARLIQQSLLPRLLPALPAFRLEAECLPAGAVGGDWYDYIPLPNGRWGLVLADVSGKGMAAALMMSAVRGMVRSLAPLAEGPACVLGRVNQMLIGDLPAGRYVTMNYAVFDPGARTLTFANAGHPSPLFYDGSEVRPVHTAAGMPLGLLTGEFTEVVVHLPQNFRLLFYSDGISEALNGNQEFGTAGLADFLALKDSTVPGLMDTIRQFSGDDGLRDDATAILLSSRVTEPTAK